MASLGVACFSIRIYRELVQAPGSKNRLKRKLSARNSSRNKVVGKRAHMVRTALQTTAACLYCHKNKGKYTVLYNPSRPEAKSFHL